MLDSITKSCLHPKKKENEKKSVFCGTRLFTRKWKKEKEKQTDKRFIWLRECSHTRNPIGNNAYNMRNVKVFAHFSSFLSNDQSELLCVRAHRKIKRQKGLYMAIDKLMNRCDFLVSFICAVRSFCFAHLFSVYSISLSVCAFFRFWSENGKRKQIAQWFYRKQARSYISLRVCVLVLFPHP